MILFFSKCFLWNILSRQSYTVSGYAMHWIKIIGWREDEWKYISCSPDEVKASLDVVTCHSFNWILCEVFIVAVKQTVFSTALICCCCCFFMKLILIEWLQTLSLSCFFTAMIWVYITILYITSSSFLKIN